MKKRFFKFILAFIGIVPLAQAQFIEIGGGVGTTNVRSDLGNANPLNSRYGGTLFFRYNFNEVWVLRADASYLRLGSADKNYSSNISPIRNYSFSTNVLSGGINAEFNFLNFRSLRDDFRWSPFLTAGISGFLLFGGSPGVDRKVSVGIPFGLGMKYKLSEHWNLGAMFITTKTFIDGLDGMDKDWPTPIPLKYRGVDEATNDWFYYLGVTISYTIYKLKCPDHHDPGVPVYWQR